MNGLTAADFADTGQWRLILNIHPDGIDARLENTLHSDIEPQPLFSSRWDAGSSCLLRNIENAVYDHPRVLDDFSARIVIFDRKVLFIPTALVEDTEGAEENFYTSLYESEPADVMTDTDRDLTAAYSPAPGVKGFLNRTFPGARIGCHLMDLVRAFRREGAHRRMFVSVRDGEADFILLDGGSLLSASTHGWNAGADIVYHAFNILDVYGVSQKEASVVLCGDAVPEEAEEAFRNLCAEIEVRK